MLPRFPKCWTHHCRSPILPLIARRPRPVSYNTTSCTPTITTTPDPTAAPAAAAATATTAAAEALPSTAPKPSINIKAIREFPEYHTQNCINRNYPSLASAPARIVSLYEERTALQPSLRGHRERHNTLSGQLRSMSPLKEKRGEEGGGEETRGGLIVEAKELKSKISIVEVTENALESEMKGLALQLPNWTSPETPVGSEPTILGFINPHLAPPGGDGLKEMEGKKSHTQIGAELGLLDFSSAGTVSGWGWYFLLNEAVLLEQALISYTLFRAQARGWKMVASPSIVYSHIASACGFRPRDQNGEQQIYTLESSEGKMKHCLTGTAEIPLAGMWANKTVQEDELPTKLVGVGRAFRAEAGARGVESKGLYRVHEFTKIELFAWTLPDPIPTPLLEKLPAEEEESTSASTSTAFLKNGKKETKTANEMFHEMLDFQKSLLESLDLHARILEMPTTDLGASAARKIDIEVYMPSRASKDPWGEVSSLSNCTDYQSRRLNTRVKRGGGKTEFPYTLNGTALAVPRVLMAILENGWDEKRGGVVVPEVLRGFMGGVEFIGRKKG